MSRDKLIIAGVAVLAVLGVLVYKQSKRDESLGAPTATVKDFPTVSAPEDIDKLSITNGDKPAMVFERVADTKGPVVDGGSDTKWVMTKPLHSEVTQQAMKDLLANLKDLKVESSINLKLDDDVRKEKQLDAAHALHLVAWKGGDKRVDELFGKSGAAGELIVLTDQPDKVWAAKGYSSYLYAKEPKDFRFKEMLRFDDANVTQVSIVNEHGTMSFTKGDTWAGTFDKKPIARFDPEKIKDMVRAYKMLNAEDFGDGKTLEETGLDKPLATVTIQLKDDAGKYELTIGKISTGTNHWAKRGGDDAIYQVTNYISEWALSDQTKYQQSADAGAPRDLTAKKMDLPKKK
ncbi:MAG TPA: DUF4340 domain-containing protein [Polyangiaceae bacterium]|jgi:hypothetical protein